MAGLAVQPQPALRAAAAARPTLCPLPQPPGTRGGPAAGSPERCPAARSERVGGGSALARLVKSSSGILAPLLGVGGSWVAGPVQWRVGEQQLLDAAPGPGFGTAAWHGGRWYRKTSAGLCKRVGGVAAKTVRELIPLLRAVWV